MSELKRYGVRSALFAALPLLGLVLGATACSGDSGDSPEGPDTPVRVGFTISARAEAGDGHGFEQGTGAEYALYKDLLHFYLFDNAEKAGDSKFIAEFEPTSVSPVGTETGGGTASGADGGTTGGIDASWYVEGELTADVAKKCAGGFRFVVLANVETGLAVPDGGELYLSAVNGVRTWPKMHAPSGFVSDDELLTARLPMYGCRRYPAAAFRPEVSTDLGEINLLRAVAKIEVVWNSERKLNNLHAAFPTGNESYYLAPRDPGRTIAHAASGEWLNACTTDRANAEKKRHFARIEGAVNAEGKPIELYRCYLPEYALPGTEADARSFGLVLHYAKSGSGEAAPDEESNAAPNIFFADYSAATRPTRSEFSLVRNHIYRFTVSVNDSAQPSVAYEVCAWEEGSAEIEFD